jgi:RimJ/RimL family protein N-acetyltransferase
MQQKWRSDTDKLTFIICDARKLLDRSSLPESTVPKVDDTADVMIGDVNMFFVPDTDDEPDPSGVPTVIGEVEIMIASQNERGRGIGLEVLRLFLWYVWTHRAKVLDEHCVGAELAYLRAKIDASNLSSIRLFQRIGFTVVSMEPNYFGEIELRRTGEDLGVDLKVVWEEYSDCTSTLLSYQG